MNCWLGREVCNHKKFKLTSCAWCLTRGLHIDKDQETGDSRHPKHLLSALQGCSIIQRSFLPSDRRLVSSIHSRYEKGNFFNPLSSLLLSPLKAESKLKHIFQQLWLQQNIGMKPHVVPFACKIRKHKRENKNFEKHKNWRRSWEGKREKQETRRISNKNNTLICRWL